MKKIITLELLSSGTLNPGLQAIALLAVSRFDTRSNVKIEDGFFPGRRRTGGMEE